MKSGKKIQAVVFDPYDTLFDMNSVSERCWKKFQFKRSEICELWYRKQLEYSWLRTMTDTYVDFWQVTKDALEYALKRHDLELSGREISHIAQAYLNLELRDEVMESLKVFRPCRLTILSNGNPKMLDPLIKGTGLDQWLDGTLTADTVKKYKPSPEVYELAVANLGLDKDEILYVTSESWDAAGAKKFGFVVGWIKRSRVLEKLEHNPDYIASNILELAQKAREEGILI